ncbi:MAG TPA: hypothetical protein VHM19_17490, partial [Polyangiales bacterium]|nr:hypothetical protein [Polyangiales bacterium]
MGNARTQIAPTTLRLGVALAFAACVLLVTAVPGVFSVDDDNYLVTVTALQRGQLHVVGTEGLPPSRELLFFEPATRFREVTATPVYSTAPPLYAFMAWPFAWFGLFGLIALNVLAYCATGALVFAMTRRLSQQPRTPWLALGIFMLCTYSIEYAQGLWPHMLAVALTTAAANAAMRARAEGGARDAAVSGLCAGLAIGTRYQNLALALLIGAGAVLWGTKRARIAAGFTAGLALPLMAASTINALRLGTWNPVSKGPWYITLRLPDESI